MALVANAVLVGLSLILGIRLLRQYVTRPRPHTLGYAVGLLLTAAAAFPELFYHLTDQVPTVLWWLYWSSASALVGFLAVGTGYLLSPRFGQVTLVMVALLTLWVTSATLLTAGAGPEALVPGMFHKAPNPTIRLPFLIQNIGASLVIFVGALLSFIRTRGIFAVFIALGTLVFAGGGSAAGNTQYGFIFAFSQTLGITLLYTGVSLSLQGPRKEKGGPSAEAAQS